MGRVGIVPAGGKGSRLAPYPGPKELFPIGWQPYSVDGEIHRRPKVVSQYIVESMVDAGVSEIFFVVGDRKHDVMRYYGNGVRFGTRIAYLFQEQADGMVSAINLVSPWIEDRRVLFGMPDTVFQPPDAMARLVQAHEEKGADITLGLFTTTRPWKFGMVDIDDAGRIVAHVDKPLQTSLSLMWGLAVWEQRFTQLIQEVCASPLPSGADRSETVLGDVIDAALARRLRVCGHHFENGRYIDIGTYDEIVEAQQIIAEVLR